MSQKPIKEYVLPFLDYCEVEKGLSNNTQKNYRQYLKLFTDWLEKEKMGNHSPNQLTQEHIWKYRLYLAREYKTPAGKNLTKKSQNYYLIALRALLRFFAERDIESLPSSKIKLAKHKDDKHVSFLTPHEVEKILAIPDTSQTSGLRDRTIMEVLFSTGMRVSEIASLNTEQVSFLKEKNLNKTFELSIVGKGSVVRTIFISPRAAEWLKKYLDKKPADAGKALFINLRSKDIKKNRLSERFIQKMVSRCALLAGISKKVTPHTLRHTYATDLLSHGADLRSVQELLGHKNVSTTQVYTHVTNKHLRDIHEKFHGRDNIDH